MSSKLFEKVYDRHNSDSAKYDGDSSILPLTVADTDFQTSEKVVQAIKNRAEHPLFGYVKEENGWKKALIGFYKKRFGLCLEESEIGFSSNVLSALDAFLLAFTNPGDPIIINSPVYNCFFSCIEHTGRVVKDVPILLKESRYCLDLEALEKAMDHSHALILCSPHNPMGFAYSKEELVALFALARRKGCLIFSDEIHGLIGLDEPYIPSLCLEEAKEVVIMASSPSKTFNTAGIHAAFVASKSKALLEKIVNQLGYDDTGEPNCFSQPVLEACYSDEGYVDGFLEALRENRALLMEAIQKDGRLGYIPNSYTYLAWLDCSKLVSDAEELVPYLKARGIALIPGKHYGELGKAYLRLNFALPKEVFKKALNAMLLALDDFEIR